MPPDRLSTTFAALADPTRRAILVRLVSGASSVKELARPFEMTLPGVSKHLKVLEKAGLIQRSRDAQWRPCRLDASPLREVADWVEKYRRFWEERFDRLDDYLRELKTREKDMAAQNVDTSRDQDFVITRVFDAPRAHVFKAWIEPEQMAQWWGPRTFADPVCEMDVRPGGAYRIVMRGADGVEYPITGKYLEIAEPERLILTMDASEHPDAWHDMVKPNRAKEDQNPAGVLHTTATFEDLGGKTKLIVRVQFESVAIRDAMLKMGMTEGWSQSLNRLEELMAKRAS